MLSLFCKTVRKLSLYALNTASDFTKFKSVYKICVCKSLINADACTF